MSSNDWHVEPIDDIKEHEMSEYCACNPEKEDTGNGYMIIHNSYDGREHDEEDHVIKDCQFCIDREIAKYMPKEAKK